MSGPVEQDPKWELDEPIQPVSWETIHRLDALNEALPHFRRPFAPAAVKWKVQAARKGWGTVIAYIDARLVIERLNVVAGGAWEDPEYRTLAPGVEECALTVFGQTRRDVGKAGGFEKEKAARSDSLKRAAVKFGIGVSIYALKAVDLRATDSWTATVDTPLIANKSTRKGDREVWSARMSPLAETWLADMYEKWLEARGEALFGPSLDHGDEVGAQGLEGEAPASSEGAESEPAEPKDGREGGPLVEGERAEELRAQADRIHAEIVAMNAGAIPKAKHKADLRKAGTSLEALEAYAQKLGGIANTMREERA